jgi:putative Flp pilus-assembly TadE/G-like protein
VGERGQALPLVVLSLVVLIGFAGLAIDLARVWVTQQELQRAVDASTLAAGQDLPDSSTAYTAALNYSGTGNAGNGVGGWGVTANPPSVTFECSSHGPSGSYNSTTGACLTDTSGDGCHPTTPAPGSNTPTSSTCNAVRVTETAKVSTSLLSLFIPSFTVSASSTAASRGVRGLPEPMNIFVILDTTGSMTASTDYGLNSRDSTYCNATVTGISGSYAPDKLDCAKAGVRALLQAMPMTNGSVDDDVGILVFPALTQALTPQTTTTPVYTTVNFASSAATTNSASITSTSTSLGPYVGDSGESITVGSVATTIKSITSSRVGATTTYTVTLNAKVSTTKNEILSFQQQTGTTSSTTYTLAAAPSATDLADETDCNDNDQPNVTYPPWTPYTNNSTLTTTGGIPSVDSPTLPESNYTSPGYVDDYPGYQAVGLASNYLSSPGVLNTTSPLVESVYWAQCTASNDNFAHGSNGVFPGGDYYGIKAPNGQGSYLAGAITAAQYLLWQQPQTRTIDNQSEPVTNAIIILSDGELNDPNSGADGVDPPPGSNNSADGNVPFSSDTPCQDAFKAAQAAKADNTLIFSIAYDDSGGTCQDSGNPSSSGTSYNGSLPYNGSAPTLLEDLATSSSYFADQSTAGDLTSAFTEAENQLTGSSDLIPDCTQAPPNC